MGEDETKILENSPTLKRIEATLESLKGYLKAVETKIDQQGFNTKPMWEKTLAELVEVNQNVATLSRKIDVFSRDMLNLRQEQLHNEERLSRLESENEGGGMINVN